MEHFIYLQLLINLITCCSVLTIAFKFGALIDVVEDFMEQEATWLDKDVES